MATPPSANAIAAKKLMDSNDFYKKLYRKFDKSLNSCLESFQKTINVTVTKAENRLYQCEQSMHLYMKNMKKSYEVDLTLAENLVNKELKSKVIMSQWTNMFLTTTEQSSLDALTFAISRFALNVCLCFRDVTPAYIVETQVHKNLIYYIGSPHKLVSVKQISYYL